MPNCAHLFSWIGTVNAARFRPFVARDRATKSWEKVAQWRGTAHVPRHLIMNDAAGITWHMDDVVTSCVCCVLSMSCCYLGHGASWDWHFKVPNDSNVLVTSPARTPYKIRGKSRTNYLQMISDVTFYHSIIQLGPRVSPLNLYRGGCEWFVGALRDQRLPKTASQSPFVSPDKWSISAVCLIVPLVWGDFCSVLQFSMVGHVEGC